MTGEESPLDVLDPPQSREALVAVLEELAAGVSTSPEMQTLVDAATDARETQSGSDPALEPVAVEDVTLRWSKTAYHSVIESLPDAIVVVDGDGRIRLVNGQTEQMFGYRRAEMHGWPIELLVPERFRAGHVAQRDSYLANPRVRPMGANLSLFGRRKNGTEFPVEISLSPIETEHGTLVASTIRDTSEKKAAEAQLHEAEQRYRTLVEEIPAVTFMASLDGGEQQLYVSPQIEQLLGFSQKEWLENPILWFTQLHPEDQERWHREFARTCSTGEHFLSEYRFLAKDGSIVWVHGEAKMVRDENGQPSFLQGVAFDITGRKKAEETLRKARDELLQEKTVLLNEALDAVVMMDADGEVIDWNPQAEKTFGWARDEAVGQNLAALILPPSWREAHARGLANFHTTRRGRILNKRMEFTALRRNGDEFPVELAVTPIRSGNSYIFSAFVRDITERKQARESIEASARKYRTLVETTKTGYVILDPQARVIDANMEYASLSGHLTPADILGRSVLEWTIEFDRDRYLEQLRSCLESAKSRSFEVRYGDASGRYIPIEVNATRLQTEDGWQILSLCRDITERKRHQQELEAYAYAIAHDLAKPLRTMNWEMKRLQRGFRDRLDEAGREHVARAIQGTVEMGEMMKAVEDNENIGRSSAKPVDCDRILASVLKVLAPEIDASGALLEADPLPAVMADDGDLLKVFQNLIGNALKYNSEERRLHVRIGAQRHGADWRFAISDNGIGIRPEKFKEIFVIFKRVGDKPDVDGRGIGLANCKNAIERRGGRIWVESQPGEGSTFYFTLPAADAPAD